MDQQQGAMARIAVWLASEVGEGGVFTKQQLRDVVPNVEQADRRMRDLRPYGWRIDTNAEDARLLPHELKLVEVGDPVWIPSRRRKLALKPTPAQQRRALIQAGYACDSCGVGVAEVFPDDGETAKLAARFVDSASSAGGIEVLCQRCRLPGSDARTVAEAALKSLANKLDEDERKALRALAADTVAPSAFERAKSLVRRWPADDRWRLAEILELRDSG